MNLFTKAFARVRRMSAKQAVIATVFALAVVGSAAIGTAVKQKTFAADCSNNAIMRCGVTDPNDFYQRVNVNQEGDTQAIYSTFGLNSVDYLRFAREAVHGWAYNDGTIRLDDGTIVATDATSIGRLKKTHSVPYVVNGKTYWSDTAQNVFRSERISVMMLFDANGVLQFAVMNECGNPTTGHKITPQAECKALTKTLTGEKDTYMFTTSATAVNATIAKVVYDFGDGTTATKSDLTPVKHTFTKAGNFTVKVKVTFNLPGGKTKTVEAVHCQTQVTVVTPFFACESLQFGIVNKDKYHYKFTLTAKAGNGASFQSADFDFGDGKKQNVKASGLSAVVDHTYAKSGTYTITPTLHFSTPDGDKTVTGTGECVKKVTIQAPLFACVVLTPSVLNDQKTQFRFTVTVSKSSDVTLKDADFTLDNKTTTTGVTTKDANGDIFKDYSFTDSLQHTIVAKVNFNVAGDVQSATCQASVTPTQTPECKPGVPVGSPQCEDFCKPNIPVGDSRCQEVPPVLPNTGMGNLFGLFAGSSAVGAVAHRVVSSRRRR